MSKKSKEEPKEEPKSGLLPMDDFISLTPEQQEAVFNPEVIPDEMEIYWRDERYWLPEGKDFSDLTKEELADLKNKYRFDPLRPGKYQGITGISTSNGRGTMI